jgi:hypothetical protein
VLRAGCDYVRKTRKGNKGMVKHRLDMRRREKL